MKTSSALALKIVALAAAVLPLVAQAEIKTYSGPNKGNWSDPANWTPSGVPVEADDVILNQATTGSLNVNLDVGYPDPGLKSLLVDSTGGGLLALKMANVAFTVTGTEIIGSLGAGTFTQTNGSHVVNGSMVFGEFAGSTGTYNLQRGTLEVIGSETIGAVGGGIFNQTGGTHIVDDLFIANQAGSTGTYTLSNGALQSDYIWVGGLAGSQGAINQTGGTHTTTALALGAGDATARGTYSVRRGSFTSSADVAVGDIGIGVFAQRSGNTIIGTDLILGNGDTASGAFSQNAGRLTVGGTTYVGNFGLASYEQFGGKSVHQTLLVGNQTGSFGEVTLTRGTLTTTVATIGNNGGGAFSQSGGKLFVDSMTLGVSGVGVFVQTGGRHTVTNDLVVGGGGEGSYEFSGGRLNVGGSLVIGDTGTGTVQQSKTTLVVGGPLVVGNSGSGTYSISEGQVRAGGIEVGANGSFTASASRVKVSGDVTADASATWSTDDSELVIMAGSHIDYDVLGLKLGADPAGFSGNAGWGLLTLERNVTLSLNGDPVTNALYVDMLDMSPNQLFNLSNVIIGNGINIYYNADNAENAFLMGLSYNLGQGGRLIPVTTVTEEETAQPVATTSLKAAPMGPPAGDFNAVPEPSAALLALLGGAALGLRRRSVRRRA